MLYQRCAVSKELRFRYRQLWLTPSGTSPKTFGCPSGVLFAPVARTLPVWGASDKAELRHLLICPLCHIIASFFAVPGVNTEVKTPGPARAAA